MKSTLNWVLIQRCITKTLSIIPTELVCSNIIKINITGKDLSFAYQSFYHFFFSTRLNTHIQFVQFKNTYNKRWRYSKIALHMETHTSYNTGGKTYLGKYLKKNYFQKYMVRSFDISSENAKIIDAVIKIMTKLTSTQMT